MAHQVQIPGLNFTVDWNEYNDVVNEYFKGPWATDPGPLSEYVYNYFANRKQFLADGDHVDGMDRDNLGESPDY